MNDPAHQPAGDSCDTEATQALDVAEVVARYRPALLRYFLRHLASREDAEDMAQETLARLTRNAHRSDLLNTEAYLFRCASNLLRDRFRRDQARRTHLHVALDEAVNDWPGEEPSCERVYEDKERLRRFLLALDALPTRCREVFLLQRYEGLTYGAIAKRLGISVSAVEKHMMRALLHFDTREGEP